MQPISSLDQNTDSAASSSGQDPPELQYDAYLDVKPVPAALDFHDTSFFRERDDSDSVPELPTPATVRAQRPGHAGGKVKFSDPGLFVKFGQHHRVSIEEAQTLQAIRRAFPNNEIPVPELVGWRVEGDTNFIYMSLVPGKTLEDCWAMLTEQEKLAISDQLREMLGLLRSLRQRPDSPFIGSISRTRMREIFFELDVEAGPFSTVKEFNDRLQFWAASWLPVSQRPPDHFRSLLPDDANICFSHADISLDNTMVSGQPGQRSVAAIIDWGLAGWYPEFWEYCKMMLRMGHTAFNKEGWSLRVLMPYDTEYEAVEEYWQWHVP